MVLLHSNISSRLRCMFPLLAGYPLSQRIWSPSKLSMSGKLESRYNFTQSSAFIGRHSHRFQNHNLIHNPNNLQHRASTKNWSKRSVNDSIKSIRSTQKFDNCLMVATMKSRFIATYRYIFISISAIVYSVFRSNRLGPNHFFRPGKNKCRPCSCISSRVICENR